MADSKLCSSSNAETKILALKEALCTQQQLLQKLYTELEEEREASATAASEALSMILRLQGEKAAEKMEAIHYRRMAEEKIQHAEESLMIFRELMCAKEMEIASLEYQIQAYKCKRSDAQFGELCVQGILRSSSLPADQFNESLSKFLSEIEEHGIAELCPKKIEEDPEHEFDFVQSTDVQSFFDKFVVADLCSYKEKIKQLDEQLKEFSHPYSANRIGLNCDSSNQVIQSAYAISYTGLESGSQPLCSMKSKPSKNSSYEPIRRRLNLDCEVGPSCSSSANAEGCLHLFEADEINIPHIETKASENPNHATSLYDVFEVPNENENNKIHQSQRRELIEEENRLKKPEPVPQGTGDCCSSNDESELVKKMLQCAHLDNKISAARDNVDVGNCMALVDPKVAVAASQAEVQKLHRRMEKLEHERWTLKQEISHRRDEELMLLREITQKLNVVQSEIKSLKVKKNNELEEFSLASVMEAMLFYSL